MKTKIRSRRHIVVHWSHHLCRQWHHLGLLKVLLLEVGLLVGVESIIEKSIIVVLLSLNKLLMNKRSGIVFLTFIHVFEVIKDPFIFYGFFIEYFEHDFSSFGINGIAVLRLDNIFSLSVEKSIKMLIVDILDIKPLYFKESFEFKGVILPPKRKCFLVNARS